MKGNGDHIKALKHQIEEWGFVIVYESHTPSTPEALGWDEFTVARSNDPLNTTQITIQDGDTKLRLYNQGDTTDFINEFYDLQEPDSLQKIQHHLELYL